MRFALLFFLLLLPLAAQAPTPQQRPTAEISSNARIVPPRDGYRFPLNQTWVYGAEWRLFNAGIATLRMEQDGARHRVIGTADAIGAVALLYRVRDRFDATLDPQTWCSQTLAKHTEEGFRRLESNQRFDYSRRRSVFEETNLRNNQSRRLETEIPGCVTDVVSAIYYLGSLPLAPGNTHLFPVSDRGTTGNARATVEAREEIVVPAGTFKTVRVRVEATSGKVKDRGRAWVWYTDDAARTPVQMRARMFWGSLTLRLQRVETTAPGSAR